MRRKVLSIDAETNGLWGQAFAIAATLHERWEGTETKYFIGRCPIKGEVNSWVEENVLPQIQGLKVTYNSYEELLKDFIAFYMENKENADIVVHMGLPVESKLFLDAHAMGFLGDWDAPYPLIDICTFPEIHTSVDGYCEKHGIIIEKTIGGTHNPLYDCRAAAEAYMHYLENYKGEI